MQLIPIKAYNGFRMTFGMMCDRDKTVQAYPGVATPLMHNTYDY